MHFKKRPWLISLGNVEFVAWCHCNWVCRSTNHSIEWSAHVRLAGLFDSYNYCTPQPNRQQGRNKLHLLEPIDLIWRVAKQSGRNKRDFHFNFKIIVSGIASIDNLNGEDSAQQKIKLIFCYCLNLLIVYLNLTVWMWTWTRKIYNKLNSCSKLQSSATIMIIKKV